MRAKIFDESLIIHTVPLAEVHVGQTDVRVEFDDIYEKRHTVVFAPLQAVRMNTTDCFDLEILVERVDLPENPYKRYILEVIDSPWIELLKRELKKRYENATFMEKSALLHIGFGQRSRDCCVVDRNRLIRTSVKMQ